MKTITITEADIEAGVQGDPCNCPTAIAGRRCLGVPVHVGSEAIYLNPDYREHTSPSFGQLHPLAGWSISASLPDDAVNRIHAYDITGKMEPFSFDIDVEE